MSFFIKIACLFFCLIGSAQVLDAQTVFKDYMKKSGFISEGGWRIVEIDTNHFVMMGDYFDPSGQTDTDELFLWAYPPDGQDYEMNTYGNPYSESPGDLIMMPDSGFAIAGFSYLPDQDSQLYQKTYIIRTDKEGNVIWERTYGKEVGNWPRSISLMPDGNFLVTVLSFDTVPQYMDFCWAILCLSPTGDSLWGRRWPSPRSDFLDYGKVDNRGNIHLFGSAGYNSLTQGRSQHYKRLDKDGNTLFEFSYNDYVGTGSFIRGDIDEWNHIYTGRQASNSAIQKFSPRGELIWEIPYDFPEQVMVGRDGMIYVYGQPRSSEDYIFFSKFTPDGEELFRREMLRDEFVSIYHMIQTLDGGFAFTGHAYDFNSSFPNPDLFIMKVNCEGELIADVDCPVVEVPPTETPQPQPQPDPSTSNYILAEDVLSGDFLGVPAGEAIDIVVFDLAARKVGAFSGPSASDRGVWLGPAAKGWYLYRMERADGPPKTGRIWKLARD